MSELPDTSKTTSNEDAGILASAASESSSKLPKCVDMIWRWRKCSSAGNHFRNYYIYGEFPPCEVEKLDLKTCLAHKFSRDPKDEEYLLKAKQRIKEQEEDFIDKPSRHIWQFRENPAADWSKKDN